MFRSLKSAAPLIRKVQPALKKLAAKQLTPDQIVSTLKQFDKMTLVKRSYTSVQEDHTLKALTSIYGKELANIYALISQFILCTEPADIPLFLTGKQSEHSFAKKDMVLMMCLMSMFLVPPQHYEGDKKLEPRFNHVKHFGFIFTHIPFKTISVIEYLKKQLSQQSDETLTLRRVVCGQTLPSLLRQKAAIKMQDVEIREDSEDIEKHYGTLKTDFANQYIGGGSLIHGAVQEQIMFAVHPEMYTSMLLCQKIEDNQAIVYIGYKKYFNNEGYGYGVQITGLNKHKYPRDMTERPQEFITAIDAINFNRADVQQFSIQAINREIVKAYTGFNVPQTDVVCTGNWGCGVFGGDHQLKFMIQWIAATMAGKKMLYCPFGKTFLFKPLQCIESVSKLSISQIYEILICIVKRREKSVKQKKRVPLQGKSLFEEILQLLHQKHPLK